jgi:copper resistance protein B
MKAILPLALPCALTLAQVPPAHAQHTGHQHSPPPQACTPEHAAMGHCKAAPAKNDDCPPEHAAMGHCEPAEKEPTASREPVPSLADADRAAAFPTLMRHMEHAPETHWRVLFDRFEAHEGEDGTGQAWEATAWVGGDTRRLWLRSEGERDAGGTEAADLEVLYGRSISPWWDLVAGVRHEFQPGDGRTWLALGTQGMAPYRFELSATLYLGESGRTAASFEAEYELLLSNRLILQPMLEAIAYGQSDRERGIGSGLSTIEAGLRLRYEPVRRFAPYVGYTWLRAIGNTADLRRATGVQASSHGWVAGVRFWF